MSSPNVACELMMGWWGVGFGGGARSPMMCVMQSSPCVQCMVKVGCAPAVCGASTGSCQDMCVGARPRLVGAGKGWRGVSGKVDKGLGTVGILIGVQLIRRGWTDEWMEKMEGAKTHTETCVWTRYANTLTTTLSHLIIIIMQV